MAATRSDTQQRFTTLAERWNGTRWRVARTPSPGSGDDGLSGIAEIPHRGGFWAVGSSLQDLVVAMLTISDNDATDVLFDRVGIEAVNISSVRLGLADTVISYKQRKTISARSSTGGPDPNSWTAR
jgi:beta-lactamase family protein